MTARLSTERYGALDAAARAAVDRAEIEAWTERVRAGWHEHRAEERTETTDPIVDHARRVVGGTAAGHWCNCFPEQIEAALRFLADVDGGR